MGAHPPRILLVDDEVEMLEVYTEILARIGAEVRAEADPRAAAAAIESGGPFDLVVLDLRLPFVDGHELLRRIRSRSRELPVLVVTGYPTRESAERCRLLGIEEYVRKPFAPDEFVRHVRRALASPHRGGSSADPTTPRSGE